MSKGSFFCILSAGVIGAAIGYLIAENNGGKAKGCAKKFDWMDLADSIIIMPKTMEKKAKKIVGDVKQTLGNIFE